MINRQQIQAEAERIYQAQQAVRPQYEKMGMKLPAIMMASAAEISRHLLTCAELSEQYKCRLSADALWGKSVAEITAVAEAKTKKHNRRAGVRALVAKYGHEAADQIVNKHSGRHIR